MWKYKSCDNQNISLHDHSIDKIFLDNDDIILFFSEGFDVVKTHELNNTGKSKHTTASQIVLKNAKFIRGFIGEEEIKFDSLINLTCDFEILEFNSGEKTFSIYANSCSYKPKYDREYAEIEFSCSEVLFCWNDYSNNAWFEDF
ncbi:MAG: hypothetical protein FWD48_10575 [Oscillospiraceae bacterium]|nr:hypothetical protein [Oscillospiraceae bacterium]